MDRRAYLMTVKNVLTNFTNNINHGRNNSEPVKLLDYVRNKAINLMIVADNNLKKKIEVPTYMLPSSESESEAPNSNQIEIFNKIIDEYLGLNGKQSSWYKALEKAEG